MYLLPHRAPRRYRGKYPNRIRMWSYGNSPSQRALGAFLSLRKPVHIELNDGRRFIAARRELLPNCTCGIEFREALVDDPCTLIELSPVEYSEMLTFVRAHRTIS